MKSICLVLFFFLFLHCNVSAQIVKDIDSLLGHKMMNQEERPLPTKEVIHHIGGEVYIFDTIVGAKVISDTLKLLYIGGKYPNHILTVLVKGKKVNHELSNMIAGKSHFSGKVFMYEGKPAITVTNYVQLGTQIKL